MTGPRLAAAAAVTALLATGCGGSSGPATTAPTQNVTVRLKHGRTAAPTPAGATGTTTPVVHRRPPKAIAILPGAHRGGVFGWIPAARVHGQIAAWISRTPAFGEQGFTVTVLRFDQRLVTLTLHAGSTQPGGSGWRFGDVIAPAEQHHLLAAFNSGFQESYGGGGFEQRGRVGWPLKPGFASVVTYADGTSDVGAWDHGVPAPGRPVAAVRQNMHLLIDAGVIPGNVDSCIKACWGDPLDEQPIVARSGLGVTATGQLLWAAGHNLSVRALADALHAAGAVRAMELDINPAWVAGYLYFHPHGKPIVPVALAPGQSYVDSAFLAPYYRDFFTVRAH
jgi:hypothetical protein